MDHLRICKRCNLKAYTIIDLELFVYSADSKYKRRLLCRSCHSINTSTQSKSLEQQRNIKNYKAAYYINNKEQIQSKYKDYYKSNNETIRHASKSWKLANMSLVAANNANRKALKLQQTPILTNKDKLTMKRIYRTSSILSNITGVKRHVDHIIPLSLGGLHHPTNLQIITAEANLNKGNSLPTNIPKDTLDLHINYYSCSLNLSQVTSVRLNPDAIYIWRRFQYPWVKFKSINHAPCLPS